MGRILAVGAALPAHRYPQDRITEAFIAANDLDAAQAMLTRRLHASSRVATRHLVLPLEEYDEVDGFARSNDLYIEAALDLGARAIEDALSSAGLAAHDVDVLVTTTVTGIAVPSLDARLLERIGLRDDVVRVPLFGLGCAGGAGGLARLDDLLRARPGAVGVLLAVEVCSLTTQRGDASMPHLVASALFGDGAAAVVAVGNEHHRSAEAGPGVVASASRVYPGTERAMGWDVGPWGLRIVLDVQVPDLVAKHLRHDVDALLDAHGLAVDDIAAWVCHPGGPKVLEAVRDALDLDDADVRLTWDSLASVGNLSSASVLLVLRDTLTAGGVPPGEHGVLLSMGPGFAAELVLLRWS